MVATSNLPPGHRIADKYRIVRRIGRGSAGTVYRAVQENVDREVALKLLSTSLAERPAMVERFRREAHLISQLTHPNTVTLFDYGATDDGLYYIVMELLEGQTLRSVLRRQGALSPPRATRILAQVLRSLAEAHDKGIVHRDLKPDNIFLAEIPGENDYVKVLDFGIAKALDRDEVQLTEHGTVFGTPSYMAPEQATGQGVSPATDVYAVALLFYEMLSGQMAFRADTMYALLNMQVFEPVPTLTGDLSEAPFNALIAAASAKDPAERPKTAGVFLENLKAALRLDTHGWLEPVSAAYRPTAPLKSLDALLSADARAAQPGSAHLTSSNEGPPAIDGARDSSADGHAFREVSGTVIIEAASGKRAESPPRAGRGAAVRPGEAEVETVLGLSLVPSDAASVASDAAPPVEQTILDVVRATASERPELSLDIKSPFEAPKSSPPMATDALVGRGAAQKVLKESLKPLMNGAGGGLGLIVGPPGIGRTHLLEAFLAELPEQARLAAVLVQTPELGVGRHLSVVFSALRQLRSQTLDPDGLISQQMDRWLHAEMGPGHPLFTFFARLMDEHAPQVDVSRLPDGQMGVALEALAHLALTVATAHPLLLIFDDAQRLDDWTLRWLTMLADGQGLTRAPLAVWASVRVGPAEAASDTALERLRWSVGGPRVVLKPLSRDEHEVLVKLLAPASAELCAQLWSLTSGHPGQTLACFEHAVERQMVHWRSGRWCPRQHLAPPEWAASVGGDEDDASAARQLVIQWAAVLGDGVPRALLQGALRRDPRVRQLVSMPPLIDELVAEGFMLQEGDEQRLTLRDGLTASSQRRRFAQREGLRQQHEIAYEIKKNLSWSDPSARELQLGEHLMMSGAREGAVRHLLEAGDIARRAGDLASSRRGYELALSWMEQMGWEPTQSTRVDAEVALAEVRLHLGMLSEVAQALTALELRLEAAPERRAQRARVGQLLGLVHAQRGELEVAAQRGEVLLKETPISTATVSQVEVIWSLGRIAHALGARPLFAQAQARLTDLSQSSARAIQGRSFLGLGIMSWLDGDVSGARAHLEACLEVHRGARCAWPVAMAHLCLGHQALEQERFEDAASEFESAEQHADRLGAQPLMCEIWCSQVRLGLERRDEVSVEARLRQAWAMAGELTLPSTFVDVSLTTAWWCASRAEVPQARSHLREGERLLEALGQRRRPEPRWSFTIARVLSLLPT